MRTAKAHTIKLARALRDLRTLSFELGAWELWILVLMMVTVFGIAARGPITNLPSFIASFESYRIQQVEQDPYDLQQEAITSESRYNVETGL